MESALILGGAGYLGNAVIDYIKQKHHGYITVFDNLKHEALYRRNDVEFVNGDIRIQKDIEYEIDKIAEKAGTIILLAGIVGECSCNENYLECMDVNVKSVISIVNYIKQTHPRLRVIYVSSCSVYGQADKSKSYFVDESSKLQPLGIYAGSKVAAEHKIKELDNYVILRLGTLYGVSNLMYGRPRFDLCINAFISQAIISKKITYFGGKQMRTFIHVKDVAEIIGDISFWNVNKHVTGIFNASSWNSSIFGVVTDVKAVASSKGINVVPNMLENPEKFDLRHYCVNPTKLMENFKFISFMPKKDDLSSVFDEIQAIVPRIRGNNVNQGYFVN